MDIIGPERAFRRTGVAGRERVVCRGGSDRAGRWPWGVWFALVGVSAGTVASFASVGWAFLWAADLGDETDGVEPVRWDRESVVIEAAPETEATTTPEDEAPATEPPAVSAPEVSVTETESERTLERADAEEEAETPLPVLVPIEERDECESDQARPDRSRGKDDRSDKDSKPTPVLERLIEIVPRSKE